MNFLKKNINKFILLAYAFFLPFSIIYADTKFCEPGKICNPISQDTLNGFIKTLLTGILKIGIPIVALAIIYCGFLFVEARGNTEKLTKAKSALLYTLIGSAILLGSWAIAELISNTILSVSS
jgi:hypothetical protein